MKITYIAWRKIINSDVLRVTYGINSPFSNKGDHAIQNFNTRNANPGLWRGFSSAPIPYKKAIQQQNKTNNTALPETFDIILKNSANPIRLWTDKNAGRADPIKIDMQIWDRTEDHASNIIEVWYLAYMRILNTMLGKLKNKFQNNTNLQELCKFVESRCNVAAQIKSTDILKWIYDTQDGFNNLTLNTSFLGNDSISQIETVAENYFYLVVKCEENGQIFNLAMVANKHSSNLHPAIKSLLLSNSKSGGEDVDIDVSSTTPSLQAQSILRDLRSANNIILYGPPGTGKTHLLQEICTAFSHDSILDYFDIEAPIKNTGGALNSSIEWCTFHPSYSYENFVEGLMPVVIDKQLGYKRHIGPITRQAFRASCKSQHALLIIDEINRANTDEVFGNTIAILDKNIPETITFSPPLVDNDLGKIDKIGSSEKLFVIGTMNSLDKSVCPLSLELKKRFCIIEVPPNHNVLRQHLLLNTSISKELAAFCCDLMININKKIRDFCGKEYELGQGYFWDLTTTQDSGYEILKDIIANKIVPHLQDTLSTEDYSDFFGLQLEGKIYKSTNAGYEFCDFLSMPKEEVINAFASSIGVDFRCPDVEKQHEKYESIEEYEDAKIDRIHKKLQLYRNVILSGVSGVGKTYICKRIQKQYNKSKVSYWHNSTDYTNVVEGIFADFNPNTQNIDYFIKNGDIKQLSCIASEEQKLMVIEGVNKSKTAECFGELITLLEPDKRSISIKGYEDEITLPHDMLFLCTSNPLSGNNKLDSALKRRFVIIKLSPDYELLRLHLNVKDEPLDDIDNLDKFSSDQIKNLAVHILQNINKRINDSLGEDYQIGHSAFWELQKNDCSLCDFITAFDTHILQAISDNIYDEEIAQYIFGANSPIIVARRHSVELTKLSSLSVAIPDVILAIKGIVQNV